MERESAADRKFGHIKEEEKEMISQNINLNSKATRSQAKKSGKFELVNKL